MKKLMYAAIAALGITAMTTGCDPTDFTPEMAYKSGYCIGVTAGAVVDSKHYPAEVINQSILILEKVKDSVPTKGQTFTQVWLPLVDELLAGRTDISETNKQIIKLACTIMTTALDGEAAKHPEILDIAGTAKALAQGAYDGYIVFVKPIVENDQAKAARRVTLKRTSFDQKLYDELMNKFFK